MFKQWLLCNTIQVADDSQFLWYYHNRSFAQEWNVNFIYRSLDEEKNGKVVIDLIVLEGAKKWD